MDKRERTIVWKHYCKALYKKLKFEQHEKKKHEKISVKEEFEDTKGVIGIPKSKKDRQHNGQKKKEEQRSRKHTH